MSGELTQGARELSFDAQAAWLRRFQSNAESNLQALAFRLREALPDRVTVRQSKSLFSKAAKVTGLTVEMEQSHFILEFAGGRLKASIAMVVRGIALNTKSVDPAEWFAKLSEETKKTSDHAQRLALSLSAFMAS